MSRSLGAYRSLTLGRWALPKVLGRWALPEVLGRWALPEVLGRWALPKVLGRWALLNTFFRASGEANAATQRYCLKHVLRDGFRYTTILCNSFVY